MNDTAVLVVDMLNTYEHQDAEQLAANVADIIDPLAHLITRVRSRHDADLIYVNDNYGDFAASFDDVVGAARSGIRPDLVEPIVPARDCVRLIKVRHSAFYCTALHYLLGRRGVRRLILTGQVTEQCILYTALDAYVRHYSVVVPPDAVAPIDPELGEAALQMMRRNMAAELIPAVDCMDYRSA